MRRLSFLAVLILGIAWLGPGCGEDDDEQPEVLDEATEDDDGQTEPLDADEIPPIAMGRVESEVLGEVADFGVQPVDDDPEIVVEDVPGSELVCPRSPTFWREHHRFASEPERQIPWPLEEQTLLCEMPWFLILSEPARGDAWLPLARQYIAARLNMAGGVSPPVGLIEDLNQADQLLNRCQPLVARPQTADRRLAGRLTRSLAAFNEGACLPLP